MAQHVTRGDSDPSGVPVPERMGVAANQPDGDEFDVVNTLHFDQPRPVITAKALWVIVTLAVVGLAGLLAIVLITGGDGDPARRGPTASSTCSAFVDLTPPAVADRVRAAVTANQVSQIDQKTRGQIVASAEGLRELALAEDPDDEQSRNMLSAAIAYDSIIAAINQGDERILTDALDTRDVVIQAIGETCKHPTD